MPLLVSSNLFFPAAPLIFRCLILAWKTNYQVALKRTCVAQSQARVLVLYFDGETHVPTISSTPASGSNTLSSAGAALSGVVWGVDVAIDNDGSGGSGRREGKQA